MHKNALCVPVLYRQNRCEILSILLTVYSMCCIFLFITEVQEMEGFMQFWELFDPSWSFLSSTGDRCWSNPATARQLGAVNEFVYQHLYVPHSFRSCGFWQGVVIVAGSDPSPGCCKELANCACWCPLAAWGTALWFAMFWGWDKEKERVLWLQNWSSHFILLKTLLSSGSMYSRLLESPCC